MGSSKLQNQFPTGEDQLFGKATHVLDRTSHGDGKTGPFWTSPHETHPMAPEEPLAHSGIVGESHSDSQVPSSPPALVAKGGKRPARPKLALSSSRGSDFHRRIKRRLGRTFRRLYRQGRLVCAGKKIAYQFPRIEGGFIGPKGLRTSLPGLGSFSCHQQQHCGSLHKQRRRHAFRLCMCSPLETPVLVQSQGNLPESTSHSGPAQCDSRQTVQTPSSHSDGVVSSPGCLCSDLPQMPSSQGGPVAMRYNCKLPQFVSPVPNPKAWAMDASTLSWEDLDLYAFPPVPLLTNVLTKALSHRCKRMIIVARGWPNMPWFWDLVEMSSQIPVCLPNQPDLLSQPFNGNLQRDLQNLNLHAWLLEPKISGNKGSLTKW